MCTETIVNYTCGCFEIQELNCCDRTADKSASSLIYAICAEPYPSEINMEITCSECSEEEEDRNHEKGQWGRDDDDDDEEDLYGVSDEDEENKKDGDVEGHDEGHRKPSTHDEESDAGSSHSNRSPADSSINSETTDPERAGSGHSFDRTITEDEIYNTLRDLENLSIHDDDNKKAHPESHQSTQSPELNKAIEGVASMELVQGLSKDKDESVSKEQSTNKQKRPESPGCKPAGGAASGSVAAVGDSEDADDDGDVWFDASEELKD